MATIPQSTPLHCLNDIVTKQKLRFSKYSFSVRKFFCRHIYATFRKTALTTYSLYVQANLSFYLKYIEDSFLFRVTNYHSLTFVSTAHSMSKDNYPPVIIK